MIYRINSNNKPVPVSNPTFNNVATRVPVGFMMMYAGTKIPDGFMSAWGQSLSREEYPELFEIIGTKFGAADDEHFNLPDTREAVVVGAGTNSKLTNDVYTEGQFKEHQFASHTHLQASHTHTGANHTHIICHCHGMTNHSHTKTGICNVTYCRGVTSICTFNARCASSVTLQYTDACFMFSSYANICACQAVTLGVCSATATNNATGAESGGTHGKRMGIYYIIKVEADKR